MKTLIDAIKAAEEDTAGGKVLLDLADAKKLIPDYAGARMYPKEILREQNSKGAEPVEVIFKRSTPGNPHEEFAIIPLRIVYGETDMWPGENKFYIEGINVEKNAVGLFALDCLDGIN